MQIYMAQMETQFSLFKHVKTISTFFYFRDNKLKEADNDN